MSVAEVQTPLPNFCKNNSFWFPLNMKKSLKKKNSVKVKKSNEEVSANTKTSDPKNQELSVSDSRTNPLETKYSRCTEDIDRQDKLKNHTSSISGSSNVVNNSNSSSGSCSSLDGQFKEEVATQMQVLNYEGLESRCDDTKSLSDYLMVAAVIGGLPYKISADLVTNMLAVKEKRRPYRDTALDSLMGHCYRSSTLRQLRIMTGVRSLKQELSGVYYKWTGTARKLKNFNCDFAPDCSDFVARWIHEVPDRKPNDPVLLYFHGGGYALKTCQPQVSYICELAKSLRKQRLSVLVLDYTITPFAAYPTQRNQAVACINVLQRTSSNIMLLGDSCGGNLALSALLEEDGSQAVRFQNINGCVLISPWVDPGAQCGSMNSKRDILSKQRLNEMLASYVPPHLVEDPRISPIKANSETWKRVLPKNTCIVWGSEECLADQCAEFLKHAQIDNYFVERNGTHDCILRGLQPKPCQYITEQLCNWIAQDSESNQPVSV